MGFSLRTTDPRLPEEDDTGPGGDRGCRFCNIMVAPTHERLLFSQESPGRQAAPTGMKVAVLKFVPLGKGGRASAHFAAGGLGGTHTGAKAPPLPGGDFRRSCSCRLVVPRSMKIASPLGQGGTSGGFERGNETHRVLSRSFGPSPTNTVHQPPRRGRWPGIPSYESKLRRGTYFQGSLR